ncbi:eukaryotic translation initiation factor 3 subunit m [Tachypleus tridentatus]|uniref:eukaryotic translation initiation factor 3 subunit m n=1 Tax=Tachypleus tridentatus TaxID=6853 RepID=UPI003FD343D0
MSVPAFIDITEDIQCQDLRSYFKSLGADISEENSPEGFLIDLQQIIGVCDVCFKEQSEADIESVLNSIVSLLVLVPPDQCDNLMYAFCEKLTKTPSVRTGQICLRVLQNLYEGLLKDSPLLFDVYYSLVRIAGQTDSISSVFTDVRKLKCWFQENNVSTEKAKKLLRLLHEVLQENKQSELASKVMIELLGTYTEDNASHARDDAHRCIVACLADPTMFLMDHLLALKPVRFLEGELIHDLLTIFVSEKLSLYIQFYNNNKDFLNSLGLSHEQNMQKMRLLTFMQMGETKKEISFETIQKELHLTFEEIESFVIDVLRTKLVRAKIDHVNKKVLVSSTMHRTFGKSQWQQLREVLVKWRNNLSMVESSMESVLQAQVEPMAALQESAH